LDLEERKTKDKYMVNDVMTWVISKFT